MIDRCKQSSRYICTPNNPLHWYWYYFVIMTITMTTTTVILRCHTSTETCFSCLRNCCKTYKATPKLGWFLNDDQKLGNSGYNSDESLMFLFTRMPNNSEQLTINRAQWQISFKFVFNRNDVRLRNIFKISFCLCQMLKRTISYYYVTTGMTYFQLAVPSKLLHYKVIVLSLCYQYRGILW